MDFYAFQVLIEWKYPFDSPTWPNTVSEKYVFGVQLLIGHYLLWENRLQVYNPLHEYMMI